MSTLQIILSPLAVDRLHEALTCLSKFGDSVTLEARRNKLNLRTLNPTHSAHILICLAGDTFCDSYNFVPDPTKLSFGSNGGSQVSQRSEEGAFKCKMNVKALLPVFRGRYVQEPINKERDENMVGGIDKCEIVLQEKPNKGQCRLVVKLFCRQGIMKTFRLQYEEADIIHASFLKEWAVNKWAIRAGELKKWMEHFGPKTEHLEIAADDEERVNFTSYTLKIIDGARKYPIVPHRPPAKTSLILKYIPVDILKTPLQTSIELDLIEFNEFQVATDTSIAVSVKDFKSIVTHAGTFEHVQIQAVYGEPGQPMQITYDQNGMFCEFTLMTRKKGAAGPAGKAEPVAKIMSHRSVIPGSGTGSVARTREPSIASRKSVTPAVPPTSIQPVVATRDTSRSESAQIEMPPPPLRVTPFGGSVSAVPNSKDSPLISGTRQSSFATGIRGSLQPRQSQSLFIMDDDDDVFGPSPAGAGDEQFEALLDDLDDEDVLGWDASLGSERVSFVELQERAVNADKGKTVVSKEKEQREGRAEESGSYVEATQRKNVVKGLFDD
ncbi:hypothetical protein TWF679_008480 [Orbilia oligospora]|uniref:DNA repair protein rad9 n=1 Tax=Orbilia oligospora TaxID=2813651 RepID=A0A8H8V510_ORBOL|nr:hypothetical protein TWF679_008480 [Orbilia oligospora]